MTSPFDAILRRKILKKLCELDWQPEWIDQDGCNVVMFQCEGCEKWYEEEREAARVRTVKGRPAVCLGCDDNANEKSVTAVRMFGQWLGV